jgi:hypothetical protein
MEIIVEGVSFNNLLRARTDFEDFREDIHTKRDKAGAVKAFECAYTLAWKTMRKIVDEEEWTIPHTINGIRDLFRAAALLNLIDDPVQWFMFQDIYVLITQNLDDNALNKTVAIFDTFSHELSAFINKTISLKSQEEYHGTDQTGQTF